MKQQKGFTLIELMIVVAIIGILAAIALPAYQNYTGRAQAAEGLTSTAGVRSDIALWLSENNAFPGAGDQPGLDALALEGKYFSAGGVGVAAGVVTITFDAGVHNGQAMVLTPTRTGNQISQWICTGLASTAFLPSGCRA
jgi:type IV pilus assembly protein PilA